MRRVVIGLAAALALPLAGAHAAGNDSLLSGYGGPGDGEQALLGQQLYGGSGKSTGGGTGSARPSTSSSSGVAGATTAQPQPTPTALFEPATPAAKPPAKAKARHPKQAGKPAAKPAQPHTVANVPSTPTFAPVATRDVSAPAAFGGRDVALLALLLLALLVLAGFARRLAVQSARARRSVNGPPRGYAA